MEENSKKFSSNNNYGPSRRRILQTIASGVAASQVGFASAKTSESFVDILGTDPSTYPTIGLTVHVDSDAGKDGTLTKDDFEVYEGGERRTITDFEFSSTALDLLFVFDDSGSMSGEIAAMQREAKNLTDTIAASEIDARYGLVSFRDTVNTDLKFTEDADSLKAAVDSLAANGGGDFPEDNFDAIETGLEYDFRDDAQKVVIDITDATSHHDGDGSDYSEHTLPEVAKDLREQGALFIGVSPGYDDPEASLKVLAQKTGGLWVDINDADFEVILRQITRLVIQTYILKYETDTLPGDLSEIGLTVSDPDRGTGETTATVSVPEDAGPTVPARFRELRNAKLRLAGQIDSISQSITEKPRVEATLDDLERKIESGDVDGNEAISAVKRMIQGEDLTELSLAGLSPVSVSSPADETSKVGEPSSSPAAVESFDISGRLVQNAALLAAGLTLALRGFSSVVSWLSRFTSRAREAMSFLDTAISTVFGAIPWIRDRLKEGAEMLSVELEGLVGDGIEEASELYDSAAGTVERELRDPFSNGLMEKFETGFDTNLKSFDQELGVEDGKFGFEGSDTGAGDAASTARSEIIGELEQTQEELHVTEFVSGVGALMAVGGALFSATGIGTALAIVGAFFSLSFSFLGSVSAADGMFSVRGHHNEGLDNIVVGGM